MPWRASRTRWRPERKPETCDWAGRALRGEARRALRRRDRARRERCRFRAASGWPPGPPLFRGTRRSDTWSGFLLLRMRLELPDGNDGEQLRKDHVEHGHGGESRGGDG